MKTRVIVEISVVPIGTGSTSLSHYVADCLSILKKNRRVKYELTPMGTVIEGDIDEVLEVAKKMHEAPFSKGVRRVVTTVKIDDRRDKQASMRRKVASVRKITSETKGSKS